MAEVLIGKACLFRSEQYGHAIKPKMVADELRAVGQRSYRVLELPFPNCTGSDHEPAVADGGRDAGTFLRRFEQFASSHGRAGFTKRDFIRFDDAQAIESEVAHGPRCGSKIERIACFDQNDGEAITLAAGEHVSL